MALAVEQRSLERRLLDAIADAVVVADELGRIVYCNEAARAAFGAHDDELLHGPIWGLLAPDASRRELEAMAQAIIDGEPWTGMVTGQRVDGTTFPQRVTLSPLHGDDGELEAMVAVGQDVSVEVEASAMARAHDERFRRTFDESPVAMGIIGLDLTIQRSNAALQRLLGYRAAELEGLTLEAVTHPDDVELDRAGSRLLLEGHARSHQIQKRFVRKDGEIVIARVTGNIVCDDDGEPLYGIGTVEDLTATVTAFTTIQEQKERLAMTLEAAGVATFDLDLHTNRYVSSDNLADLIGIPFDEVPETFDGILAMVHPDDQALFLEPNPDGERVADRFDVEFRFVRPGGDTIWVGCKGSFVRDDEGQPASIRGTLVNLTEKRAVEIRRVEAEERYRHTIEAANDAFVGVDDGGRITEWNAAAERMFGWTQAEIVGQSVLETLIPPDRRDRYEQGLGHWADIVQAGHSLPPHWEMTVVHRDGHTFIIEMSVVTRMDEQVRHLRAFVRDITARKAHEQRLEEQAVTDALTGLPDRTVMLDRLSGALVRLAAGDGAVALLFIDLDGFKAVNDDLGHAVGDQLLVAIAHRLRAAVRPTDTVARIGGDEFAVVCGDLSDHEDAMRVADRILDAFDASLELDGAHHDVRVSIGIAVALDPGAQAQALLQQADRAMYRAKRSGGHQAVIYEG